MDKLSPLRRVFALALSTLVLGWAPPAAAQLADLADVPIANSPSSAILPNMMYVLDDSGSMNWNWMPDQVMRNSGNVTFYHCKKCINYTVSSVSTGSDTIRTSSNHNAAPGSAVTFKSGTPPAPLALNTTYYIVATSLTANTFALSTTPGGAAINITGSSTGATLTICSGPGGGNSAGTPGSGFPCGNDDADPTVQPDTTTIPTYGDPLFYATVFNRIWYNPDIAYVPGVDSTGASLGAASPAAAKANQYTDATATNLPTGFRELIYCNVSSPSAADLTDTARCRYNGKHNVGPFLGGAAPTYFLPYHFSFTNATGNNAAFPTPQFQFRRIVTNSNPHYYKILPNEYCSDTNLTSCALANAAGNAPDATNLTAAPLRWCKTQLDAQLLTVVSGSSGAPATARCRKKFDRSAYPYPRVGRIQRVDIIASGSFPKSPTAARSDCAGAASCTYAEELQNFANWWQFYRSRMALMKTATGKAFLSIDDRFRVGFITINPVVGAGGVSATKFLGVGKFDAAQRSAFYSKLYAQTTNGGTPLREALSRVGRYYAGKSDGINTGMTPDPVEASCQTNYALLTTDGYWNGNSGDNLTGSAIGNEDDSNAGYTTRAVGAFDGSLGGSSGTLADVAAYYYKTDLRTDAILGPNNVPTNQKDTANHQHMVTFTLGLGLEGYLDYLQNYESSVTGDFAKIKAGTAGQCSWTTGTCNWPSPVANEPGTLDDLWHAAVNARGMYFSASDPNSLALGLQSALAQLSVATASASASATSSPNITQTDNYIFSSTFRTGLWDGEIQAKRIDVSTGNILPAVVWSAQALLDGTTTTTSDTRNIFTINGTGGGPGKPFKFASLSAVPAGSLAAEQSYFANKCAALAQCPLLTVVQQLVANSGDSLVNYLRGQRQHESFTAPETIAPFRIREHVLGDPVNATPAYIQRPRLRFADAVTPTYGDFKDANVNRRAMLYIASNDGMLHAFDGEFGNEVWAYVPRITMPEMHRLATTNWGATHRFSVDGSPQLMDAYFGGSWKTVLVAGLNAGGRGYYALDITDPDAPKVLWEVCSSATVCATADADIGYTFGNPVIAKREFDGRWVAFVTSGLNNTTPGDGRGYLYTLDLATGAILNKVSTGFGSVASPSGLGRISGYADDFSFDNTARFIYGGDLWGNVWKFTTATATPTVLRLAELKDAGGRPQSITTRPELASIDGFPVLYVGTGRYIGEDDVFDPATLTPALPFAYRQSVYAIKDRGVAYGNFRTTSVVQNQLLDAGSTRSTTNNAVDWATQDGWFLDFNPGNTSPGERVNLDPQLVQGTLVVVANVPNNSSCAVGGDSWIYQFDYRSGRYVSSAGAAVAGVKTTGKITVGSVIVRLPSGVFRGIATRATGEQDPFAVSVAAPNYPGRRISWRELFSR